MAFTIPNEATASNANQAELDSIDLTILTQAYKNEGVISGCVVSQRGAGANMSVDVAVGQVRVGGYFPYTDSTATQNVSVSAADGTNPRFDLVTVDYNGDVVVTAGTPASNPVFPAIPSNSVVIASIYVAASVSSIVTSNITDKRMIIPDMFAFSTDWMTGNVTTGRMGDMNLNTTAQGTAGSAQQIAISLHPGTMRVQSGAASGNGTQVHVGGASNTAAALATDFARARFIVSVPTITSIEVYLGLSENVATDTPGAWGTDGVWFEFDVASDNSWRCYTRASSTSATVLDTAVDLVAGNWYQLDMVRLQNGNWQFAVNNAYKGQQTSNLPTSALNFGIAVETQTAAARSVDVDFLGWDLKALGQRWT